MAARSEGAQARQVGLRPGTFKWLLRHGPAMAGVAEGGAWTRGTSGAGWTELVSCHRPNGSRHSPRHSISEAAVIRPALPMAMTHDIPARRGPDAVLDFWTRASLQYSGVVRRVRSASVSCTMRSPNDDDRRSRVDPCRP